MSELDPLQGYNQISTSTFSRTRNYHRRCQWILLSGLLCVAISSIVITIVLLSSHREDPSIQPSTNTGETPLLLMSFPIKERNVYDERSPPLNFTLTEEMSINGMNYGETLLKHQKVCEEQLYQSNKTRNNRNASFYHQQATVSNAQVKAMSESAVLAESSLKFLLQQNISMSALYHTNLSRLLQEWPHCQRKSKLFCPLDQKYRTLNASCNHFKNAEWGSSLQPFRRILPAVYEDGLSSPRSQSMDMIDHKRYDLPNPRKISLAFQNNTKMTVSSKLSVMFLTWGQFLDHDIIATASTKGINGSTISCLEGYPMHPQCFPITIDSDDSFYIEKGVNHLEFIRSAPAPQCQIGSREQMNQATSFIDGSMIYGTTHIEGVVRLRAHHKGYLSAHLHEDGRWTLPISKDPNDGCNRPEFVNNSLYCFRAGDSRVNEQIGLTSMHTLWLREHNQIADTLADMNPHWDDEQIYQESRRIVIAKIQHITYNEFVPLLLGEKLTRHLNLRPLKNGYSTEYNENINPGISNEFATAVYRFGHSMLQGLVAFEAALNRNIDFVQLHKTLFYPYALWDMGKLDAVLRGSTGQQARMMDTSFSNQLTHHLFQPVNGTHGVDLFAINIQRGRDHGLPPYVQWQEVCQLHPIRNWEDLHGIMKPSSLEIMKQVYKNVGDIDLYAGILAEIPIHDGILGVVGSCIAADQFLRLKIGDRFWYENDDPLLKFTTAQLEEIRKTTLARILCDNSDSLGSIQRRVMENVDDSNKRISCSTDSIPSMDLTAWEDRSRGSLIP